MFAGVAFIPHGARPPAKRGGIMRLPVLSAGVPRAHHGLSQRPDDLYQRLICHRTFCDDEHSVTMRAKPKKQFNNL